MDSFEINKVAGAALMTLLIVTVIGHVGNILVPEPAEGAHSALASAKGTGAAPTQQANAPAAIQPIAPMLAKANPAEGEKIAKVCQTCHTFDKGGPARVGPNLYSIVDSKRAHMEGFAYSDAIKNLGGTWGYEELNQFLAKPSAYAPGTKMTFAGLPDEQKRADVIAYLRTLSDNPPPLPQ
jgi:cytochrome c